MASVESSAVTEKSKKKFQCTYQGCQKTFGTSSHLKRHENIHSDTFYRCKECDAIFTSQYTQKRHIDNKHLKKNPKKYQCEYCEEDFNKKSWYTRHIYRHSGILPYACTFENCESRFLLPSRLKRHLKSHLGYPCPKENCSEKFGKWTELTTHLKIVHPKVYKCSQCNQVFSRSTNLNDHSMTHKSNSERPVFLCPKIGCHRSYSKKSNMRHHVRYYHGSRPFNCTIERCSKFFKSQEKLDIHLFKQHSILERIKKEIIDDIIPEHRPSKQNEKEDLDDHISRQSPSGEIRKEDLDDYISRQSPLGEIKKDDLDDSNSTQSSSGETEEEDSNDNNSRHSPLGQLKKVTVIYLNKDSIC